MATLYYDQDADMSVLEDKTIAIVGYGSQGHAHALNAKESGVNIVVGLHKNSKSRRKAESEGMQVMTVPEAVQAADVVMLLTPDTKMPKIYADSVEPHLEAGMTLMFSHGFNIHYRTIQPPENVNVVMVAPKGPGHRVRELYQEGSGVPALFAVEQDPTGEGKAVALAYARAIGCARAGVLETTFQEETETDLFGEQSVLCGGVTALVRAGFETLVKAGYQPEVAFFECMHELKLIVDLLYQGGLSYMWYSVSNTAEYGGYVTGDMFEDTVKEEMAGVLQRIQDGSFAKQWIEENENGLPNFNTRRSSEHDLLLEQVGAEMRQMMPFLDDKQVKQGS